MNYIINKKINKCQAKDYPQKMGQLSKKGGIKYGKYDWKDKQEHRYIKAGHGCY